jgi:hypothetical protein
VTTFSVNSSIYGDYYSFMEDGISTGLVISLISFSLKISFLLFNSFTLHSIMHLAVNLSLKMATYLISIHW